MNEIVRAVRKFLRTSFRLDGDRADESVIIESITNNVSFRGTNLWTLIFAILIASIGLNVNSTAVVIGAMLISPLMGPIMGIGLGIGILDFGLMKKGLKNLLIAAVFAIATSYIYFLLSPLHEARNEIVARTTPSIWDVLIAFFGGLAGIIAATRQEKSNVLPGVAIATALMPPLCTAGFGLATREWYYFLGAIYLFFINGFFICVATFLIVRYLKLKIRRFATRAQHRGVVRSIWIVAIVTLVPSIFLAVRIVQRTIFEENAKSFVQNEFRFTRTQVVNQAYNYDRHHPTIELLLIGEELSKHKLDSLRGRMSHYGLDSSSLVVRQGLNAKREIDLAQIKASILGDIFPPKGADSTAPPPNKLEMPLPELGAELNTLFPGLKSYSLTNTIVHEQASGKTDTLPLLVAGFSRILPAREKKTIENWLIERCHSDTASVIINYEK